MRTASRSQTAGEEGEGDPFSALEGESAQLYDLGQVSRLLCLNFFSSKAGKLTAPPGWLWGWNKSEEGNCLAPGRGGRVGPGQASGGGGVQPWPAGKESASAGGTPVFCWLGGVEVKLEV